MLNAVDYKCESEKGTPMFLEKSTIETRFKDSFYSLLSKQFDSVNKKQKVLCIGDSNASLSLIHI